MGPQFEEGVPLDLNMSTLYINGGGGSEDGGLETYSDAFQDGHVPMLVTVIDVDSRVDDTRPTKCVKVTE